MNWKSIPGTRYLSSRKVLGILILLPVIVACVAFWKIATRPERYQWDLHVYYQAAQMFHEHLNPYDTRSDSFSGFVYPPVHLVTFQPMTWFPESRFYYIFFALKLGVFLALLVSWRRTYLARVPLEMFALFAWWGLGAAFKRDIDAGNISVFETATLFAAFYFYVRERWLAFALFVVLAATFKLTPILFLLLLFAHPTRSKVGAFFGGCAAFAAFLAANFVLLPDLTRSFVQQALTRVVDENGAISPSTLNVMRDFSDNPMIGLGLFLATVVVVLVMSAGFYRRVENNEAGREALVLYSILVYVLCMPRVKDYALSIAIPSVLVILAKEKYRWLILLTAVLVPNVALSPRGLPFLLNQLWVYYALALCYFAWWRWSSYSMSGTTSTRQA